MTTRDANQTLGAVLTSELKFFQILEKAYFLILYQTWYPKSG